MHPQLLSYPHISTYSFLLLVGFGAGYVLARRLARTIGVEGRHVDNLTLIFLVVGLVGGRFFSRLFYVPKEHWWESLLVWQGGGLVFYGGFLAALVSVILYAASMRLSPRVLLDLFAPAAALGLTFGRIGCFMAGCCWGDLCVNSEQPVRHDDPLIRRQVHSLPVARGGEFPLRVTFPKRSEVFRDQVKYGLISAEAERSLPVHPVQLYEAAMALALACGMAWRFGRRQFPGEIAGLTAIGYACVRFALEFLRADNPPVYLGLTLSQVISILLGCAGLALLRYGSSRSRSRSAKAERPRLAEAAP